MFFVGSPLGSSWFYHRVAPPHPSTDPSPFCDTRPPPYLRSTRWKLASSLGVFEKTIWGPTCDVVVDAVQGSFTVQIGTLGLAFKDCIFFEKVFSFPSHIFWKTLGLNNMEPNFRDYCAYYVSCCVETHLPTIEKPWSIEFGTCTSQESIPIDQRRKNIGNTTVNTIY